MKAWRAANEKKVVGYQRAAVLESALKSGSFPTPRSVGRHALTEVELARVLASVLRAQRSVSTARLMLWHRRVRHSGVNSHA